MRTSIILLAMLSISALASSQQKPDLSNATKLILVTTPDWNSVDGTLTRYSRVGDKWNQVGTPMSIVVGKNGLAWDPQLVKRHTDQFPGPVKHEGDGRAPA